MAAILRLMNLNETISFTEIAQSCGVTEQTIARDLEELKQYRLIERIGPDKGGR